MEKTIDKKRSIGEVAKELGLETHVIRFWENKFPQIKPKIGKGKRRYYFDHEVAVLTKIRSLLYDEGYSIAGLQRLLKKRKKSDLKEQNVEFLLTEELEQSQSHGNNHDKKIDLDDFIASDVDFSGLTANLNLDDKSTINQIIENIELNLSKLESL